MTEISRGSAAFDIPLADFEAIALDGPDAVAFAQSQLAADVAAVAVGHWRWACWLEPKGRVIALLLLLRPAADRILLLLPGRRAGELATRLQRYVMRSRVKVAPIQPAIRGRMDPSAAAGLANGGPIAGEGDAWRIELGGVAGRSIESGDGRAAGPDADAARARWRLADAADGIPWLEGAAIEAWIPQALGLSRLDAFSTRKGCYPGQEIVARTHFLGRNKRALWRAALPPGAEPPAPGTRCLAADAGPEAEAVAEVVFAAPAAAGGWVLAVGREGPESRLHAQGGTVLLDFQPV
jgi:folate-binding protein YgfZ